MVCGDQCLPVPNEVRETPKHPNPAAPSNDAKQKDESDRLTDESDDPGPGSTCFGLVHALKLSPQEQLVAAFGFFTLKPPSFSAST